MGQTIDRYLKTFFFFTLMHTAPRLDLLLASKRALGAVALGGGGGGGGGLLSDFLRRRLRRRARRRVRLFELPDCSGARVEYILKGTLIETNLWLAANYVF